MVVEIDFLILAELVTSISNYKNRFFIIKIVKTIYKKLKTTNKAFILKLLSYLLIKYYN